jgi:Kef-type K+ transport system membrane component KefB
MANLTDFFVLIGAILLLSLATDYLGRKTRLPRVTLLLLFGFLIGPSGLNFLTDIHQAWFPLATDIALLMIGFLLGGQLSKHNLQKLGRQVFSISLVAALMPGVMVLLGLLLLGINPEVSFLLAGIATATAPAATIDVVHEMKARGRFTQTLLGVVALDDAWGLIIFSLMLIAAGFYAGDTAIIPLLLAGAWEIAGAVLVGVGLGIPAAFLTGRIRSGEPTLVEAIGVIFLCGGVSIALGVSLLLAVMAMGATIVNLAKHHKRPFHAIEHIEWPFMILFFVLAGASFHIDALLQMGIVGIAYVLFRCIGKLSGAWLGAVISNAPDAIRNWIGIALMPQAGVALGMALIASQRFPDTGAFVLNVVIGAVVVFELFGPILTRMALLRSGEATDLSQNSKE